MSVKEELVYDDKTGGESAVTVNSRLGGTVTTCFPVLRIEGKG